jgi:hypothetical protein
MTIFLYIVAGWVAGTILTAIEMFVAVSIATRQFPPWRESPPVKLRESLHGFLMMFLLLFVSWPLLLPTFVPWLILHRMRLKRIRRAMGEE